METVRAKFKCTSKTLEENGARIKLEPVVGGSKENESFFKWTPYGSVEIGLVNPETAESFIPGRTYYVDFTETTE